MNFLKTQMSRIGTLTVILAASMALIFACAPKPAVRHAAQQPAAPTQAPLKKITEIGVSEGMEATSVLIQGDQELTFTSIKQPVPPGIILFFPQTEFYLSEVDTDAIATSPIIDKIETGELAENGTTAKLKILLRQDIPFSVDRSGNGIEIAFAKAAEPVASVDAGSEAVEGEMLASLVVLPATNLEAVSVDTIDSGCMVMVQANGRIEKVKPFTLSAPARIVFDLFDISSPYAEEQVINVDSPVASKVRHYGYKDRVRLVIDTKDEFLTAFNSEPQPDGLLINIGQKGPAPAPAPTTPAEPAPAPKQKPAWVNRIDFTSEEAGKSTLIIGTTHPIKYELDRVMERQLRLTLFNTRLPSYRERPLITTRFSSAVDRILPSLYPDMKDTTLVSIELREDVPYALEEVDNLLMIHFDPSTVPPKPAEAAALPEWKQALQSATAMPAPAEMGDAVAPGQAQPVVQTAEGKVYTGEKIALDFYETDIKNVFRILREVSGKNFAIEAGVAGRVTLSLEKPVPWDQVLDLVLKMNQLGMVEEGNIIRITTLASLQQEQAAKQAEFEADKVVKEQQAALEPLITEYIPVSYSNAESDIKPHLDPILSKGRGSISIDSRTNLVVITDVADVIAKAKDLVSRLDQVTPQVIIEARIVEATTDFARRLGLTWSAALGPETSGDLRGIYDLSAAVNVPVTNVGSLGVNFSKLAGTPFSLNAQLQTMESQSEGRIISAPKIVTLNKKSAMVKQGLKYPYNKLDADGNTTTEFLDIVLELEATPQVTPDNRISMEIKISKSDLAGIINGEQSWTTKEAQTELLINDGETIVIAGIIKSTKTDSHSGIPGLKEVPIINWLFKNDEKIDNKEELLIFITPKIVRLKQRAMG